ncbi:PLP-dependent aminotransferase family protein [Sulfuracidifex metallicus DSM 6482 = JCM 9184]|nr:PLP-dependent aminotransferase family protein [Sulfuracidifex metallicus DSM 6482 = JCM 9184]
MKLIYNLGGGLPDPMVFPRSFSSPIIPFERTLSFQDLDEELIRLLKYRGIDASKDEILITTGSIQGIFIFSNTLLNDGDKVALEYPTFAGAIRVFKSRNVIPVKLPVIPYYDINIKDKIKAVYTIPTGQNPTGIHMKLEDKKRILEMAEERDFFILEDDAYGLLTPEEPTIKSLDKNGRVIYITTLSKVFSSGLRLGIMVAKPSLIEKFRDMKEEIDGGNSSISLSLLYGSLKDGSFWEGISRAKRIYEEKKVIMEEALKKYLPEAEWTRPEGGLFFFIRVKGIDSDQLQEKLARKVLISPGTKFFFDGNGKEYLRLSFSYSTPNDIEKGIEIISQEIYEMKKNSKV